MDYQLIVTWIDIALVLAFLFFSCFLWYYFLYFAVACKKPKILPKANKYTKLAILIPARNESNVIRNILNACKKLDYPREYFDVYVIIEDEKDPTNEIVKEFQNVNYITVKNKKDYLIYKKKYPHIKFYYGDKGLIKIILKSHGGILDRLDSITFSGIIVSMLIHIFYLF